MKASAAWIATLFVATGTAHCAEPKVLSPAEAKQHLDELCAGVAETDRARPVYFRSTEIAGVRPYIGERKYIKFTEPELRGAELVERPVTGTTKQAVAGAVRCHMAWRDSLGPAAQTDYEDPIAVGTPRRLFLGNGDGLHRSHRG